MVRVTENKLIIEIESSYPAALLRDLQESLINVLRRYNEDNSPGRLDDMNCLEILKALLTQTEQYEKMIG